MTKAAIDGYSALKTLLCANPSSPAPCSTSSNHQLFSPNIDFHQEEAIDFSTTAGRIRGTPTVTTANEVSSGQDVSSTTDFSTINGVSVATSKKKAAFDLWHKRKLSELEGGDDEGKSDRRMFSTNNTNDGQRSVIFRSKGSIRRHCDFAADSNDRAINLPNLLGFKSYPTTEIDSRKPRTFVKSVESADIISPKLSRHNDAAFYPNIQCVLCKEWVCSRNRYMHIESHLQYRPYKCSVCQYDNRKKIFIELHINKVHKGHQDAQVLYTPDTELEKKAWALAEQCLQHTREVLLRKDERSIVDSTSWTNEAGTESAEIKETIIPPEATTPSNSATHHNLIQTYEDVFRPNIYNSQRRGKSLLIEKSRRLGLIPDLTEVMDREEKCRLCSGYVLRTHNLIEEHVRAHLSQPSYACSFERCSVSHNSKNFIFRHMKEVHRARQPVIDLLSDSVQVQETENLSLRPEFSRLCRDCFPQYFASRPIPIVNNSNSNNYVNGGKKSAPNANNPIVLSVAIDLSSSKRVTTSLGQKHYERRIINTMNCDFSQQNTVSSSKRHKQLNTVSSADTTCLGCELGFNLFFTDENGSLSFVVGGVDDAREKRSPFDGRECIECKINLLDAGQKSSSSPLPSAASAFGRLFCSICEKFVPGQATLAQWHALKHCQPDPFACNFCENFSSSDLKSIFAHAHKVHGEISGALEINKVGDDNIVQFRWSSFEWRKMWREMFQICFDSNARTTSPNRKLYKKCCALCSTPVAGDYRVLIEHSSKHMHRQCYSCFYCQNSNNGTHQTILSHLSDSHCDFPPILRIDTSKESVDERNLLLMLCFPKVEVPAPELTTLESGIKRLPLNSFAICFFVL
uniref:C2H2-type domain-containing protein n=1 Tax=Romanomermis culicivorax TaxID=13658 RepID=A0A915JCY2_ROMCU